MSRCSRFDRDRRLITVDGKIAYLTIVGYHQVGVMIAAPVDVMVNGDVARIFFLCSRVADDCFRVMKSLVKRFYPRRQEDVK